MTDFKEFTDDLGRKVKIPFPPQRIVSTVPSTTEFLFDLELEGKIISKTRFCKYPWEKIERLPNIGGPKNLYLDKINLLNPDLILANEEENNKVQIEELMKEYPVYVSKVRNFEDALKNILNTGKITNTEPRAYEIANEIRAEFAKIPPLKKSMKVLYLIWRNPYMGVGKNTFVNSMLEKCGFENVLPDPQERYPQLTSEDIQQLHPDMILLSSEPYPFEQSNIEEIKKILPQAKIELADGEMFSWYESHMIKAAKYFTTLIENINQK